jgi:hypothetical protein
MAVLQSFGPTLLTAGQHDFGPFNVPGSIKQLVLTILQVGWPYEGGEAFTYWLEVWDDANNIWISEANDKVNDAPIPARFTNPVNSIRIACSVRGQGSRKVQLRTNWKKDMTVSASLVAN